MSDSNDSKQSAAEAVDATPSAVAGEQRGVLTQDVRLLSGGFERRAGKGISYKEVPDAVWNAWVEEGIIQLPAYVRVNPVKVRRARNNSGKDKVIK